MSCSCSVALALLGTHHSITGPEAALARCGLSTAKTLKAQTSSKQTSLCKISATQQAEWMGAHWGQLLLCTNLQYLLASPS